MHQSLDQAQNAIRRRLMGTREILWILVVGIAALLSLSVNAIQFFFEHLQGSIPRARKPKTGRRHLGRSQKSTARPRRAPRDYFVFLKYKMTRRIPTLFRYHYSFLKYKTTKRMPALFRYHYSVWAFRLRTHPRLLSSRELPRFPMLKMPAALDLRRHLLSRSKRLGCLTQYPPIPLKYGRLPALKCCPSRLPTIAIVTPSYNQAHYLEQTILSVLDNGYPALKYAVVDGGSQDETALILERYDRRVAYWASEPDGGQSHAIQKGFERINGDIMGYLNSDDILLPGALRFVAGYFATHPDVDAVYGHRILIDQSGSEIGRWILPPHSNEATKRADYIPQETLFWRSKVYRRIGGIDTSFFFAMDWDLILRFQAAGVVFHRLPYFLACFRVHDSQKTSSIKETVGAAEVEVLRERELGKDRSAWNVQKYDEEIKQNAFITELVGKCGYRSISL